MYLKKQLNIQNIYHSHILNYILYNYAVWVSLWLVSKYKLSILTLNKTFDLERVWDVRWYKHISSEKCIYMEDQK